MTPYQRGNRDGLLNAAHEFEALARQYHHTADLASYESKRVGDAAHQLQLASMHRHSTLTDASRRLRALAEALPHDPEVAE